MAVAKNNVETSIRWMRGNESDDPNQLTEWVSTNTNLTHQTLIFQLEERTRGVQHSLVARTADLRCIFRGYAKHLLRLLRGPHALLCCANCASLEPSSITALDRLDGLITDELHIM